MQLDNNIYQKEDINIIDYKKDILYYNIYKTSFLKKIFIYIYDYNKDKTIKCFTINELQKLIDETKSKDNYYHRLTRLVNFSLLKKINKSKEHVYYIINQPLWDYINDRIEKKVGINGNKL